MDRAEWNLGDWLNGGTPPHPEKSFGQIALDKLVCNKPVLNVVVALASFVVGQFWSTMQSFNEFLF